MQVSETNTHRFATMADAKQFALAGNATITLESLKTSAYYTFRIRQSEQDSGLPTVWFVNLLSGPDNEGDYRYMGLIRLHNGRFTFTLTRASKISTDALSYKAFTYFWNSEEIPAQLVVHHEGTCGRCGRKLTVPASITLGIGPECATIMGLGL